MMNARLSTLALVLSLSVSAFAAIDVSDYSARAAVTVSGIAAGETLKDFPVLVRLSADIPGFTYTLFKSDDGRNLVFTDSNGEELASEVDTWNPSGESLVWVKLPTLTASGATITMHFGHSDPVKTLGPSDVWSAYAAVWHLNADAADATGHGLAQTVRGNVREETSNLKLGRALSMSGAKNSDAVIVGNPAAFCTARSEDQKSLLLTVSGWFRPREESLSTTTRLICWKASSGNSSGLDFIANTSSGKRFLMVRGSGGTSSATPKYNLVWSANTWTHLAAAYGEGEGLAYCQGERCSAYNGSGTQIPATTVGLVGVGFGNMGDGSTESYGLSGAVDELRFYNGVASVAWIKAEYDTVAVADFAQVGTIEVSDSFVGIEGTPTVQRTDDSTVTVSTMLATGSATADLSVIATDCESGVAVTNLMAATAEAGVPVVFSLDGLASGRTYSFAVRAVSASHVETEARSAARIYLGETGADRYVSPEGSDASDGYSPLSPKFSISAAVATLPQTGGTVNLADGTYVENGTDNGSSLPLATPVVLVGTSRDPTKVILTREILDGRILRLANAGAGARFVTLRKGGYSGKDNAFPGGCAFVTAGGGFLEDCIIEDGTCGEANKSLTYGANVAMASGRLTRCIIRGGKLKHSAHLGSGLAALGDAVVENCLIVGNNGPVSNTSGNLKGGAVYLDGNARLVNCTVVGNADPVNSGIFFASATPKVVNCAVFGNVSGPDQIPDLENGVFNAGEFVSCFHHCAAAVALNGTCIQSSQPGFTDAQNGDYTLDASSVLIDVGCAVTDVPVSATDLAGNARTLGAATDIGCYERVRSDFEVGYSASQTAVFLPDSASVTFTAVAFPSDGVTYSWDFGDGTEPVVTDDPVCTHVYQSCGTLEQNGYLTVRLTASRNGVSKAYVSPEPFRVLPRTIYVNPESTSASYPYGTPETACKKIGTALGFKTDGQTVVLASSTNYYEGVVISNALTLTSATGNPSDVVVKNGGRNLLVAHGGAVVKGITFSGGFVDYGVGGNLWLVNGTVSNCVLTSGRVNSSGGDGAGACVDGGRLTHCLVVDSKSGNRTTGAMVSQRGGLVDNCLMRNSSTRFEMKKISMRLVSVRGGTMVNCTIVGGVVVAGGADATDAGFEQQGNTDDCGLRVDGTGLALNCVVADLRFTNTDTRKPLAISGPTSQILNCVCDDPQSADCAAVGSLDRLFVDYASGDITPARGGLLFNRGSADYTWTEGDTDFSGNPRAVGTAVDVGCYESSVTGLQLFLR